MQKQYFTLIICALLLCSASTLAQVGNTMANPIFAGNFSSKFTCPNTQNTTIGFTNNYTDSGKSVQTNDVYYKFTLMKTMEITISHCGSALSNTSLYLLDASNNKMASNHGVSTSISGCTSSGHAYLKMVLPAATYYIVSEGYSQNGEIKTTISGVASEFDYTVFPDTQSSSSKAVGSIAGAFDVSSTGAATYSIPIEVPLGINGMQPNIAIIYNSQAGNGVAGFGTGISGISAITRVPKSIYYDGTASGVTYGNNDAFMLDGQRLIHVSGTAGTNGAVYNTESDPFTTITIKSTNNGGIYFEVLTKDKMTYTYGNTHASTYSIQGSYNKINTWYLNRVEDVWENYITYTYSNNGNYIYPQKISYGNEASIESTVSFTYENRPDTTRFKFRTENISMSQRLKNIKTQTGSSTYREYVFSYNKNDHFSRLASVTVKNGANEALNPTYLNWNYLPSSLTTRPPSVTLPTKYETSNLDFNKIEKFIAGDVNGDGIDDLIGVFSGDIGGHYACISLSSVDAAGNVSFNKLSDEALRTISGSGLGISKGTFTADLDGDGINELITVFWDGLSKNLRFNISNILSSESYIVSYRPEITLPNVNSSEPLFAIGDFNNDGIADILIVETVRDNNTSSKRCLIVNFALVDRDRPSAGKQAVLQTQTSFDIVNMRSEQVFVADFNGNGLTDIMLVGNNGFSDGYTILWNQGNGTFSGDYQHNGQHNILSDDNMLRMGDFNGDGLPDFLMNKKGERAWYFALNNGNGTFTKTSSVYEMTSHNMGSSTKDDGKFTCMVYDFDLDGKSDVFYTKARYDGNKFDKNETYWLRSTGTSLALVKSTTSTINSDDALPRYFVLGDFNGDGRQELVNRGSYDCYTGGIQHTMAYLSKFFIDGKQR